ncbi:non-lysosomal glucosylceramidase [Acidobacteria bacterium AH-259-O06]|nr:non-lysosomal glucosylceramidase [Acidobacteria bacterium AH-259-O06]
MLHFTSLFLLLLVAACAKGGESVQAGDRVADPIKPLPYSRQELLDRRIRDSFEGDFLNMVAFPLGGIGAGCISLSGTGKLIDWEIFNKPNKGYQPRYTFLSVWAKPERRAPVFKVLEGQLRERLDGPMYLAPGMWYLGNGGGPQQTQAAGLPRMRECRFEGRFPFARVHLKDESFPLGVTVEGWSPFIPGNDRESSLPVAILNVSLRNVTSESTQVSLGINLQNRAGNHNEMIREPGFYCLYLHDGSEGGNAMFIATPERVTTWETNWPDQPIFTVLEHFARSFAAEGKFTNQAPAIGPDQKAERHRGAPTKECNDKADSSCNDKVGSLGVQFVLAPGESRNIPLVIGWYFPIFSEAEAGELGKDVKSWKNYYATQWPSGLEVARHVVGNLKRLEAETRRFQTAFFSSTLPGVVLEAASANLSVLRSPTVIRYPDGTLYGWEGCAIDRRLGFGTCNHVWHYQQAIPYLFPRLQRSILENFYFNGLRESDGAIHFRMPVGPGASPAQLEPRWSTPDGRKTNYFTAADGQMAMVCHVLREWQISGDDGWLKKMWPKVKKSLEYAWVEWDRDRDGLLEGSHHNTLDLNFSTPDPFCGSLYQAALLTGERMALYLGDEASAREYREVYESGKRLTDEQLFNGEYYHQMLPAPGDYQLGNGCISEQVIGQWYARMLGLEDVFRRENIRSALSALFKYNYRDNFYDFINVYRAYSVGGDRGLLIATWPKGGRPERPLLYADETMSGYEYQVAANLLYEGYLLEGLTVIKSIRDRHDGKKRNPYDEFEWGHHYVRTMSSYSTLLALSGFRYSGVDKSIALDPQIFSDDFRVFFSVDGAWGTVSQTQVAGSLVAKVELAVGRLSLSKLVLHPRNGVKRVRAYIGTRPVRASLTSEGRGVEVKLDDTLELSNDQILTVELSPE